MRIVRIVVFANCGVATTEVYRRVAQAGHRVHLLTFRDPLLMRTQTPESWGEMQVEFLPRELKWSPLRLARRLRPVLQSSRPDIWHVHLAIPYGVTGLLARCHPFLLTTHGSDLYFRAWIQKSPKLPVLAPPGVGQLLFRLVHMSLAASVDRVLVYSPDMMEALPRMGYPPSKLVPCFLGVDTDRFRPREDDSNPREEFRIVCTRHLEPLYDHTTLLAVVARLSARGIPVRLRLIGGGSARPVLERIARAWRIQGIVEFVGTTPHSRLPEILQEADVVVSASRSDTTALSVLEGMASGLPVVVTDVGSLGLRIRHGRNGFLFKPGDVDALEEHLLALASNPELRTAMGRENAALVRRENPIQKTIECLLRSYEDIVIAA